MMAIHIEFFRDLYAKLRASRCSIHVVKYILVTSKWSSGKNAQRGNELTKQVLVIVSKKLTL